MSLALFFSLSVSFAIGWFLVYLLWPSDHLRPRWDVRLLQVSLGMGCGAAVTSSLFFLLLLVGAAQRGTVIVSELILLLALAGLCFLKHTRTPPHSPQPPRESPRPGWTVVLAIVLFIGFALFVSGFRETARTHSSGGWDAWSIWNVRAKFLAAPGETWRNAYSPLLTATHPDYPLLLSSFIARSWRYFGEETPKIVPISTAFLFPSAVMGLMVGGLAVLRSTSAGLLAGLVLLASSSFLKHGPTQYADVPLSFYILGTLALLALSTGGAASRNSMLVLAGAFAGFAAGTKNEGLLFLGIVVFVYPAVMCFKAGWRAASKAASAFAMGILPAVLPTLYFKFALAQTTDPIVAQSAGQTLTKMAEIGRYVTIAKAFAAHVLTLGESWTHPLLLLAILALALRFHISPRQRGWVGVASATIGLQLAGYFAVYVVTPSDLNWHLSTSLDRLFIQVWPLCLFLGFMVLRPPEETALLGENTKVVGVEKKKRKGRRR